MLICLLLALASCGFHLRGTVELSSELLEMALIDARPATDIAPELRRGLERQGVTLVDGAPMVLQLHTENYERRVLSVDTAGRAQEYGLSYTVSFSLRETDGSIWLGGESVSVSRDLSFDATAVLSSSSEERQLKAEMIRDAVNSILRRLGRASAPAE